MAIPIPELVTFLRGKAEGAKQLTATVARGKWELFYGLLLALALIRKDLGKADPDHPIGAFYILFMKELEAFNLAPDEKEAVLDLWGQILADLGRQHVGVFG